MIREDGRWGGKLTSRPLPEAEETVHALTDVERSELAEVWLGRAASERRVADAFVVVRDALVALHADSAMIALAARSIDDEHRHAELSRLVASRFAARALDSPPPLPLAVPSHARASESLRHTLHVVGQCAMNETLASAFLEASLEQTEGVMARVALRELLSDEIDHARLGWAHLAACSEKTRSEVAPWLLGMAKGNLKMWRTSPRPYPSSARLHAQGAPSAHTVEDALLSAMRDLIIPGLARLALPTEALRAWLAEGAPTTA